MARPRYKRTTHYNRNDNVLEQAHLKNPVIHLAAGTSVGAAVDIVDMLRVTKFTVPYAILSSLLNVSKNE